VSTFIVRRWFIYDGVRVEPEEIVIRWVRFWADHEPPGPAAVEAGFLEPLREDVPAWLSACDRLWATQEALAAHVLAHGCSELTAEPVEQPEAWPAEIKGPNAEYLRQWVANRTASEIGHQFGVAAETVEKRIYELRRKYGPKVVPYHRAELSRRCGQT
jgi:hypothetical protein